MRAQDDAIIILDSFREITRFNFKVPFQIKFPKTKND